MAKSRIKAATLDPRPLRPRGSWVAGASDQSVLKFLPLTPPAPPFVRRGLFGQVSLSFPRRRESVGSSCVKGISVAVGALECTESQSAALPDGRLLSSFGSLSVKSPKIRIDLHPPWDLKESYASTLHTSEHLFFAH
ncbi:MAG: hypothetical protein DMG21_01305 [Acidobacteria bacterium]|nr:MAG: hypothetical protein DMG21_01305 [Acidobacteriota bacterium]